MLFGQVSILNASDNSTGWEERGKLKTQVDRSCLEGLQAYSMEQAALSRGLHASFQAIWKQPLKDTEDDEEATQEGSGQQGVGDEQDSSDDDDDDDEEGDPDDDDDDDDDSNNDNVGDSDSDEDEGGGP